MGAASGKRVWLVEWERDGGGTVVHVASTRAKAFEWVRRNFYPEREPPSERNFILLVPVFVDREASGVVAVNAYRMPSGEVRFLEDGRRVDR